MLQNVFWSNDLNNIPSSLSLGRKWDIRALLEITKRQNLSRKNEKGLKEMANVPTK